jgi:hypothetical protein
MRRRRGGEGCGKCHDDKDENREWKMKKKIVDGDRIYIRMECERHTKEEIENFQSKEPEISLQMYMKMHKNKVIA